MADQYSWHFYIRWILLVSDNFQRKNFLGRLKACLRDHLGDLLGATWKSRPQLRNGLSSTTSLESGLEDVTLTKLDLMSAPIASHTKRLSFLIHSNLVHYPRINYSHSQNFNTLVSSVNKKPENEIVSTEVNMENSPPQHNTN